MKNENILIIEDSQFTAMLIQDYLVERELKVCGIAADYSNAARLFKKHLPTIVICDIHIEGSKNGIEFISEIKENHPLTMVVFISADIKPTVLLQAQQTHPNAYLTKPFTQEQLITTIELAIMERQQNLPETYGLNQRDMDVLRLLGQGKTNIEVGNKLYISHHTVDSRRRKIMAKLNVTSINQALCLASEKGWIHVNINKN